MPSVLPDYLSATLDAARTLARFLARTGFADGQAIEDLEEISTREGLLAAYARTRASEGYARFAEGTIRRTHSSPAFDAHAKSPRVVESGIRTPRLRKLLPGRPDAEPWQAQVFGAMAEALRTDGDPVRTVSDYLYGTGFQELMRDRSRREVARAFCDAHPAAALVLLESREALARFPDVLEPTLRFGMKYFSDSRYFERVHDLCRFHGEVFGADGGSANVVLDHLWYAAFRIGRRDEAMAVLDRWAALRPVLKRPPVYRAIVAGVSDPEAAQEILEDIGAPLGRSTVGGNVLYAEQALRAGQARAAERAVRNAIYEADPGGRVEKVPEDYQIALHNVLIARGRPSRALDPVLAAQGLDLRWDGTFGLDAVEDASPPEAPPPGRVAIVMTAFDAEAYLERAISGILSQSHADLELIVVDDCSGDRTAEICRRIAEADRRVVYMRTPRNMGTYAAKNLGIRDALTRSPDFVTLCDSDDFWLRNHLSGHLAAMAETPEAVCSTSRWIRVRDDGTVEAGLRGRYVEQCPHSTFFRRAVFERAGLFDTVRFGADREFLNRIALHFGRDAVIRIPRLLTLGRRHDASLTTSGTGAISEFNESPVRLTYWRSWNEWHLARIRAGDRPRTEGDPDAETRPFEAPAEMT